MSSGPQRAPAIVINSCSQYAHATLPPLLDTLRLAGVPASDVFVVVGDAPTRDDTVGVPGYAVRAAYRPWCNVDNNAFLWVTDDDGARVLQAYDWLFYTHDTALVEPGFYDALARLCADAGPDCHALKLYGPFSMSMGAYRVQAVQGARQCIQATKNTDPARTLDMKNECEDLVFRLLELGGCTVRVLPNKYDRQERQVTMYGTDVPRIVEHWAVPGLRKIKANWGEQPNRCSL